MRKLSTLSIAALLAFSGVGQTVGAAEPQAPAQGGGQMQPMGGMQHGGGMMQGGGMQGGGMQGGGMQGGMMSGGMHEMMMKHMQDMHGQKHKGYADIVLKHTDELKLTDEQIGKITRIHQSNQQAVEGLGTKLRDSIKSAHELYLNPSSDEAAIRKAAKEHNAAVDELVETALKSRDAINALLTPDQLQKLKSLKSAP